jgi:hypothetical protein
MQKLKFFLSVCGVIALALVALVAAPVGAAGTDAWNSLGISDRSVTTVRSVRGAYFASTNATGGAGALNILTIGNAGTTGNVYVKRILINNSAAVASCNLFISRTSALPSAGSTVTAVQHRSSVPAPNAVIRGSNPTATATNNAWQSSCGAVQLDALRSAADAETIVLAPNEGLVVRSDVALGTSVVSVAIAWEEGSG